MQDQSFPRARRLRKNAEYQKVYAQGHKKYCGNIILHWLEVGGGQPTRMGFAIGRKIANAVLRNRIKRRLRDIIRTCPQPLVPGYWIILGVADSRCATEKMDKLRNDVYQSLSEVFMK